MYVQDNQLLQLGSSRGFEYHVVPGDEVFSAAYYAALGRVQFILHIYIQKFYST